MRKILGGIIILGNALVFVGCGGSHSYVKKGEISQTLEQEAVHKDYIEAIGIGAPAPDATSETQRKATSRNAAIVMAQYELLSQLKGLQLEGGITVQKAIETDSMVKTQLDAEIKGAEIVKSEWTNDGGCVVTLRLYKDRLKKFLKFVNP